jgi:hypothetical protein
MQKKDLFSGFTGALLERSFLIKSEANFIL